MANPYFKFKQFTIFHDKCAMKVGSDGVLLGAWTDIADAKKILDIGCGSGLIALMLAQRCNEAKIHAIDIDAGAVLQSEENIDNSPWKNRLSVEHISLQNFAEKSTETFDLIVSNPPFFNRSLHTPNANRTLARHNDSLPHDDLINSCKRLLNPQGRIALILPIDEGEKFIENAAFNGLFCLKKTIVYPKPGAKAKRLLLEFKFESHVKETLISEITIESEFRHTYSKKFTELVKDFYLNL